ncbi:hypothetical protein [Nakamurella multipartita]|uniref:hypothetical protein n=1 Tax=Nakamurella multipartita TaxID=53461 RepID=UPI00019E9949|nr:hypothetical protein [Nakamurella multipartita]
MHDALTDIPGVQVVSLGVDRSGGGVLFEFRDADGDDYSGVVSPGLRRITAPHPTAGFESITIVPAADGVDDDPAEDAEWIRRHGEQAVRNTAAQRAWEAIAGEELPDDQAFTVHAEPCGTVRAELLVPCDGFDAELVHRQRQGAGPEFDIRVSEGSPYVPPHLREVVQAGLAHVVSRQTGEPIDTTASRMGQAARLALQARVYRGS